MPLESKDMSMQPTLPTNEAEATAWNGLSGRGWIEMQELLDTMYRPIEALLVEAAAAHGGNRVLDVGCGTGGTTLAIARRLGAKARCVGVDISGPMIAVARERAAKEGSAATFIRTDAQVHAFEPASFDTIVSRFGVMFFDDVVQAFTNLRRAAAGGAELAWIVWRSAADNPFMTVAERAAAPLLPDLPTRRPGGPGPFALADRDRVGTILEQCGWAEIDIQPVDVPCTLPEAELLRFLSRLGPVGAVLQRSDASTRKKVLDAVRPAFDAFVHGTEVRFTAACWRIGARASS